MAVWLCSDAAANVDGRTFHVGGDEIRLWFEPELTRSLSGQPDVSQRVLCDSAANPNTAIISARDAAAEPW